MLGAIVMLATMGQIDYPTLPGFVPSRAAAPAIATPAPPPAPVEATRVPDTTDAVAWAVQDLLLRQPHDRPFLRYLWVPPWGDVSWHQVNSFLVNSAISQSSVIVLPEGVAGGWLILWDLRRLAPKDADLKRLLIVWDALAKGEPYFHVQLSKAVACRSFPYIDGKTYNARTTVPAPHVAEGYGLLERETGSFAPLLRADDFLRRVSSTIEGGLYYHFIGFIRDGRRLSEAEIFKLVGLDVSLSRTVEGDDRAAVFQSAVTGKPRTVEQVQGAIGKARITYDLFDEDVDASRHAIYELIDSVNRSRGKEIIFERSNGTFGYILTDGDGKLVDVAPPNLVSDHQTPAPVTKQLFPPLSCIRCHGPEAGVKTASMATLTCSTTWRVEQTGRQQWIDWLAFMQLGTPSTSRPIFPALASQMRSGGRPVACLYQVPRRWLRRLRRHWRHSTQITGTRGRRSRQRSTRTGFAWSSAIACRRARVRRFYSRRSNHNEQISRSTASRSSRPIRASRHSAAV
jgi:hypothetical protein